MRSGNIILVIVFVTVSTLQLIQCTDGKNQQEISPAQPFQPINQNYKRDPRQNDDEDNEDSDSTTKRSPPLIPALANILSAAVGNASLTNITSHFQNLGKLIFRPVSLPNPVRGLSNFLGLTKPEAPAPSAAVAEKSGGASDNPQQVSVNSDVVDGNGNPNIVNPTEIGSRQPREYDHRM